jgi:transcriptional regulator with XRE-family HTH domain
MCQALEYFCFIMDKMPRLYPAIAAVIKEARKSAGLSQQELADFSGLSRSYISFVECGERGISVTALYQISKALKVDGAELFRRIEAGIEQELKSDPRQSETTAGWPRISKGLCNKERDP